MKTAVQTAVQTALSHLVLNVPRPVAGGPEVRFQLAAALPALHVGLAPPDQPAATDYSLTPLLRSLSPERLVRLLAYVMLEYQAYRAPCALRRVPRAVFLAPRTACRVPCAAYRVPCSLRRVPCALHRVPGTCTGPRDARALLLLLLTAHYSLPTAHCSLLTAHCSLPTAHCLQVVVVSSDPELRLSACEMVQSLLSPLQWVQVYVPSVPIRGQSGLTLARSSPRAAHPPLQRPHLAEGYPSAQGYPLGSRRSPSPHGCRRWLLLGLRSYPHHIAHCPHHTAHYPLPATRYPLPATRCLTRGSSCSQRPSPASSGSAPPRRATCPPTCPHAWRCSSSTWAILASRARGLRLCRAARRGRCRQR